MRTGGGKTTVPELHTFRAHPSALYEIRQFVKRLAESAGLDRSLADELTVAVSEACANSIMHTASPHVRVTWTDRGDCIHVEILDEGVFRRRVRMPEVEGQGGHGIPLMMALVDEFTIREGTVRRPGTSVRLVKCRSS
jgi:anti-sigma regulatory factor (Ser/Thr protein kinase)